MMFTHTMSYTGNEVHIVVNTDTEYEKKDGNNHFGLKCQVVGYEWASNPTDVSTIDHHKKSSLYHASLCVVSASP